MNRSACIAALCAGAAASLAGCGGGGNESGPPDALLASPTAVTGSGTPGSQNCHLRTRPTEFVYGGAPPLQPFHPTAPPAMQYNNAAHQKSHPRSTPVRE